MITTIYGTHKQVECDNCDEGFEADTLQDALAQIKEDGWRCSTRDGHVVHYCPECVEAMRGNV